MPQSPFPGMDPFLEDRRFWSDLHHELISAIRAEIRSRLPPGFFARVEERLYVVDATIRPDVVVMQRPRPYPDPPAGGLSTLTATEAVDAPLLIRSYPETVREPYIDIVSVTEGGRVVATLEVISPANKRPGAGREEYRRKQAAVLSSETHLLEIDLLRAGEHTVAVPAAALRAGGGGRWDYVACLHRAGQGSQFLAWPATVRDRLPRVAVPLTAETPDVPLDLQAALTRAMEAGGYADQVDYAADPDPPLVDMDAAWVDALLRSRGLRGGG